MPKSTLRAKSAIIATAFLLLADGAVAATRTTTFKPLPGDAVSPERGFYAFPTGDFAALTADTIGGIRAGGSSMMYAPVRLDAYRSKPIPAAHLAKIDQAFAQVRKAGLKVALRFTYNYPDNEFDYLNAKDAALATVKTHIAQLAPLVKKNRDVIAVMQTGFIGAWGEGHTSSNKLDTPANKLSVVSELLAKMPGDLQILWRYPPDLIKWYDARIPGYNRLGQHNDCFLSSQTDVGTYDEDPKVRASQRARSSTISKSTYYMGETCAAEPAAIRADCASILLEGRQFNVSSLNRDYYEKFIESWKKNGCFTTVSKSLGYRLRIENASLSTSNTFTVSIINEGWARPVAARKLYVYWRTPSGTAMRNVLGTSTIRDFMPGSRLTLSAQLGPNTGRFCLAGPDIYPSVAADGRYAVRFANANDAAKGQAWEATRGLFCFRL